jgi:hypothetical protein
VQLSCNHWARTDCLCRHGKQSAGVSFLSSCIRTYCTVGNLGSTCTATSKGRYRVRCDDCWAGVSCGIVLVWRRSQMRRERTALNQVSTLGATNNRSRKSPGCWSWRGGRGSGESPLEVPRLRRMLEICMARIARSGWTVAWLGPGEELHGHLGVVYHAKG